MHKLCSVCARREAPHAPSAASKRGEERRRRRRRNVKKNRRNERLPRTPHLIASHTPLLITTHPLFKKAKGKNGREEKKEVEGVTLHATRSHIGLSHIRPHRITRHLSRLSRGENRKRKAGVKELPCTPHAVTLD